VTFDFTFPLAAGLHLRPAALLRERAQALGLRAEFHNLRNARHAALGDLLALVATDTAPGDPCRLVLAEGTDPGALEALRHFLTETFPDCDGPLVPPNIGRVGTALTRLLGGSVHWIGQGTGGGVGEGRVVALATDPIAVRLPAATSPEGEGRALQRAEAGVAADLGAEARLHRGPAADLLEAHGALLRDGAWRGELERHLREGRSAAQAVMDASGTWMATLEASASPRVRERAADLRDLRNRLLAALGIPMATSPEFTEPSILQAQDLTPSQFLALDRTWLRGLLLLQGGATSHVAILARAFGIPCVLGVQAPVGASLWVDGDRGLVVAAPPEALRRYCRVATAPLAAPEGPARTRDGGTIRVLANLSLPQEAEAAFAAGADGVGLFRSEMLFMGGTEPPGEEAQVEALRRVLDAAKGRRVVLRLLDAGGDKPLPCLPLPVEANPCLGRRGVRWYPDHADLVATQVRSALRVDGDLALMVPMVSDPAELAWVRALMGREAARLRAEGVAVREPPLGMMVEVPAAVFQLEALGREADFFSVGTNDLLQYFFATDRGDPDLSRPDQAWHPATLRLLARIVEGAAGKPLSLCGELAARVELLPLLAGLGFETLSVNPAAIPALRAAVAGLDLGACRDLARRALALETPAQVRALLDAGCPPPDLPLIAAELVWLDAPCATREEAIRLLVARLDASGRVQDAEALEEAVWAREAVSPTALGHGFAVPHALSASVRVPSLAVLRATQPLDWEGLPVDLVILMAMRLGENTHLRTLARLARRLMDPAFREALRTASDPQLLADLLLTELVPKESPCAFPSSPH
jgi:multiphosphoryl transfer protein